MNTSKICFVLALIFCLFGVLKAQEYEAEGAVLTGVGAKAHAGASGGYRVAYFNTESNSLEFSPVESGQVLTIVYSLGLSANKQCSVYIDSVDKATAVFPPTGSWDNYATVELIVNVTDNVTLRLDADDMTANSGESCASIDKIIVSAKQPGWRSSLYPDDWHPGYADAEGRFLHDFSYAGYHCGRKNLPSNDTPITVDVTDAPYNADPGGTNDSTAAIQAAIDHVGIAGGGVVYLPTGKYRIAPGENSYALKISYSGVVLRGAGAENTRLFNDQTYMRGKTVIKVSPSSTDWFNPVDGKSVSITDDIVTPTHTIPVADPAAFAPGDWIIVRTDCTDDFIADHNMQNTNWNSSLKGITIYRQVTSVDVEAGTISIDIPTRYYMKTRDNARVYKIARHLEEVAIESLAIGMRENLTGGGLKGTEYETPGTTGYEVHGSHAIKFEHVVNSWIRDFETYRPEENTNNWHTVSNVILLSRCRNVTVYRCSVSCSEYEGGGGNGYGYTLRGNDCLILDCKAYHTRHNYDFKSMSTSGNAIVRCETTDGHLASDFHMHLSVVNLIDSTRVENDYWNASYRNAGTIVHGHATSQSVFWNTWGTGSKSQLIVSRQWGFGYVIGTSGPRSNVTLGNTYGSAPEDFAEGIGTGDRLEPQSLYIDQLFRRVGHVPGYMKPSAADLNGDGLVDIADLAIFMSHWLDCGLYPLCKP